MGSIILGKKKIVGIVAVFIFLLFSCSVGCIWLFKHREFPKPVNNFMLHSDASNLLSSVGMYEYECSGICFCEGEGERRFASTLSTAKTTLFYTITGVSVMVAYRTASQYFGKVCKARFESECREENIIFDVDECSKRDRMYSKDMSADEFKQLWGGKIRESVKKKNPNSEAKNVDAYVEDSLKNMQRYSCRGVCVDSYKKIQTVLHNLKIIEEKAAKEGSLIPKDLVAKPEKLKRWKEMSDLLNDVSPDTEKLKCGTKGFESNSLPSFRGETPEAMKGVFFQSVLEPGCHNYGLYMTREGKQISLCMGDQVSIQCEKIEL